MPDSHALTQVGIQALRLMTLIREFEQRLPAYANEGLIRGSTHPSVGMEAVAVGVSMCLRPDDSIVSNHRGHAHCLARGADPKRMLAEIMGRVDGYCGGKGGSMHIAVRELGILGTNGVVGAGIGLATGAALAAQVAGSPSVAIAYFGDGATNQGVFAECLNLAAIWKLPVVFVCENNQFAQSARLSDMAAEPQLRLRGVGYGVHSVDVDGMDVLAVFAEASAAVDRARSGCGPTLLIADTYRYLGHMAGDTEIYRAPSEIQDWEGRDPVRLLQVQLGAAGLATDEELETLAAQARSAVDEAERFARASSPPPIESAFWNVEAGDRPVVGANV